MFFTRTIVFILLSILVITSIGYSQSIESFQQRLTLDTMFTLDKNQPRTNSFQYVMSSNNGDDLWVGTVTGRKSEVLNLVKVNDRRTLHIKRPGYISHREENWGAMSFHVDSNFVIIHNFKSVLLYKWIRYPNKLTLLDTIHVQNATKSCYTDGWFYAISDYSLEKKPYYHRIERFEVKDVGFSKSEVVLLQSDLPEYCVFGNNWRYLPSGNSIYYSHVAQPFLFHRASNGSIDTTALKLPFEWILPSSRLLDSVRNTSVPVRSRAVYLINALSDIKNHHTFIRAIEQINDSILLIHISAPMTDNLCRPESKCPGTQLKYVVFNINSREVVDCGNYFGSGKDPETIYTHKNVGCTILHSSGKGLWLNGIAYEIIYGSPVLPVGKSYSSYFQKNNEWLSENQPVIKISIFKFE